MYLSIRQHVTVKQAEPVSIKDRTYNRYGLPTLLAMERILNKSLK